MSALLNLLELRRCPDDGFTAPGFGPPGKRAFGGQFLAQSMAAAAATVDEAKVPTSLHLQFLRGGAGGAEVHYAVERTYDGRTAANRRILSRQDDRLLTAATASFAAPLSGPEHGRYGAFRHDPDTLDATGPAGPAPGLPLDEVEIRIVDDGDGEAFVRRLYWRVTVPLPADPVLHLCAALYVTDVYLIDAALRVNGHAMADRTHRSGTTDAAVWPRRPIRADRWNLLESRSPVAARGRAVVTADLVGDDGLISATMVQEGLIADRD